MAVVRYNHIPIYTYPTKFLYNTKDPWYFFGLFTYIFSMVCWLFGKRSAVELWIFCNQKLLFEIVGTSAVFATILHDAVMTPAEGELFGQPWFPVKGMSYPIVVWLTHLTQRCWVQILITSKRRIWKWMKRDRKGSKMVLMKSRI